MGITHSQMAIYGYIMWTGAELVIVLPHGCSVTVKFNPHLVIEHPSIRCVLCVNAPWVSLWKYILLTLTLALALTQLCCALQPALISLVSYAAPPDQQGRVQGTPTLTLTPTLASTLARRACVCYSVISASSGRYCGH